MTGSRERRQRGLALIPNLLTTMSLFCGFYAMISAINGEFVISAWAIIAAACFDGLDGRVARLTRTTSKFGLEYDSLSDLVAFGVAPGLLGYLWGLQDLGRLGWLAAFLYVATTALRLARFNAISHTASGSTRYFLGLPCPSAAGVVATAVLFSEHLGITGQAQHVGFILLVYVLSFLMISNVRYYSFKDIKWFERHPFSSLVFIILLLIIVATEPRVTLFILGMVYGISGPASIFYRSLFRSTVDVRTENNEEDHYHI